MEGKLAETAPKKPLALTIGAAVVTLLVILGVVSFPSVVSCFNSEEGMGQCLQGKLAEAGILPAPTPAAIAEVPAPAEEAAPAPEPATEVGEPELDVDEVVPGDIPDSLISATFGLLRAEPDGSVVIAGSGTPGTEVEVYENDDLLGRTIVESSGDWVLVPDRPVAPGGAEITLAEAGKPDRAGESFVVVINEDKTSEPLVVASTPGAISQVLQGLPSAENQPTQLAAADPVAPPPAPAAPVQPEPVAESESAPKPVAEAPAQPEPQAAPAPTEPAPAVTPAAEPVAPPSASELAPAAPEAAPAPVPAPTPVPAPEPVPPAPAPSAPVPEAPATPAPSPAEPPAAAPATPQPAPAAPMVASVQPSIDAIEVEGDRAFFAGAGTEGATMRLYVEDAFIADATVSGGRWLIEAGKVLTRPQQRVRVDMLQPGSADVIARAEVDFVLDLPAEAPPVAVAEAPEAPAETPAPAPSPQPATPQAPAAPQAETPAAPASAPAQQPVPTLVAVSVGEGEAQRFASGKAIIRRGDNLWTIARRVYGEGLKYTTIYQANTGQIRDPDLIYPGQVFDLPN